MNKMTYTLLCSQKYYCPTLPSTGYLRYYSDFTVNYFTHLNNDPPNLHFMIHQSCPDVTVICHHSVLPKFAHLHGGGPITGTDIDSQACIMQHLLVIRA